MSNARIISTTPTEQLRIDRQPVDVYLVRETGLPIQNNGLWVYPTSTYYYKLVDGTHEPIMDGRFPRLKDKISYTGYTDAQLTGMRSLLNYPEGQTVEEKSTWERLQFLLLDTKGHTLDANGDEIDDPTNCAFGGIEF